MTGAKALLLKRWIPAMNSVSEFAGLSGREVADLTDRSVRYFQERASVKRLSLSRVVRTESAAGKRTARDDEMW